MLSRVCELNRRSDMTFLTKGQQRVREIAAEFIPRFEELALIPDEWDELSSDDELCAWESQQVVARLAADDEVRKDSITGAEIGGVRFGRRLFPADYLEWLRSASDEATEEVETRPEPPRRLPTLTNIAFTGLGDPQPAYLGGWKPLTTMPVLVSLARGDEVSTYGRYPATYYRRTGVLELNGNVHRTLAHVLFGKPEFDLAIHVREERLLPPPCLPESFCLASHATGGPIHGSRQSDDELEAEAEAAVRFRECDPSDDELGLLRRYLGHVDIDDGRRWWLDRSGAAAGLSESDVLCLMLDKTREVLERGRWEVLRHETHQSLGKKLYPFENYLIRERKRRR